MIIFRRGEVMKLQYKKQKFQAEAAQALCEIFRGQRRASEKFFSLSREDEIIIGANAPIELSDEQILDNLREVQRKFSLPISERLEGKNFSVEMETGVGKTYTYIKTMYELNRAYGWSKFIIVVPSVAIREGVRKSFEMTEAHFAEEYGEKIRHFVYSSKNLSAIKTFVSDSKIWAMIVNVQAFNTKSTDARRITQEKLDEFNSQIPMEVIAQINPIIIIDEPQSVEGEVARKKILQFNPLMILRYSATHRDLYNQIYRLDALDAYQQRLVKKISVKGIELCGGESAGYIFLEAINLSKNNPTATITFRRKGKNDIRRITRKISVGEDLYKISNGLDEYKNFVVTAIDGVKNSVEFLNGRKIFVGQVIGDVNEEEFRRLQIRETIQSHLEREAELFERGIKVLSLFFIDEVSKYHSGGRYAKIFEEEYAAAVENFQAVGDYKNYLENIPAQKTHAGYFSVDKKNRVTNSTGNEVDAYNLIMRDKEKLLDLREPVRFIFSHSALREGWDNPNVFQICTLKQSSSDIRRRQEVGRGMRLCVNQNGERMDEDKIGAEIHKINVLTVVANESYKTFAEALQEEIKEAINRPQVIDEKFFIGKKIGERVADEKLSRKIYNQLIRCNYLDDEGHLTEKFYEDKADDKIDLGELQPAVKFLGVEYKISNAREDNVTAKLDAEKIADKNFLELWSRINRKGFFNVDIDSVELVKVAADGLKRNLFALENYFVVESGTLNDDGIFDREHSREAKFKNAAANFSVDLIGALVDETNLTRRDVVEILKQIEPRNFDAEKFISNAAQIIKDSKAAQIVERITYTPLDERFDIKIFFTEAKGRRNVNAIETAKNLYDHLIYDSNVEKNFAADLDAADEVSIYVKLPESFYIPTPLGRYSPDWAIVFRDKIYFVVETKGSRDLRSIERGKTKCAEKFFDATTGDNVKYLVTNAYDDLRRILNALTSAP